MIKDSETKARDRNLEEIARLLGRPVAPKQVLPAKWLRLADGATVTLFTGSGKLRGFQ